MNLAEEFAAGFSEGSGPVATRYTLTNDVHHGVIRATGGAGALTEPGYEAREGIVIVEPVGNFLRLPDPTQREIVQIDDGQFAGKWVVVAVLPDNANVTITCEASE